MFKSLKEKITRFASDTTPKGLVLRGVVDGVVASGIFAVGWFGCAALVGGPISLPLAAGAILFTGGASGFYGYNTYQIEAAAEANRNRPVLTSVPKPAVSAPSPVLVKPVAPEFKNVAENKGPEAAVQPDVPTIEPPKI